MPASHGCDGPGALLSIERRSLRRQLEHLPSSEPTFALRAVCVVLEVSFVQVV